MEGEFDRECSEQGGCPPILAKTQYREIRKQLLSGVVDKKRQVVGKEFDELWKALQVQGELPGDEEAGNVTKKLQAAEIKARDDLEEHIKKENEPKFIKRKWKNQKEEKERKRALLHQMAVTALAYWKNADKTHKKQNKDKQTPLAPAPAPASAPPEHTHKRLYPELPHTPTAPSPPPYAGNRQMPLLVIKEGVVNADVVGEQEFEQVKEEVTREIRSGLAQVEKIRQEVIDIVSNSQAIHQDALRSMNMGSAQNVGVHQDTLRSVKKGSEQDEEVCSMDSRDSSRSRKHSPPSSSTPKAEAGEEWPRAPAEAMFQIRENREDSGKCSKTRESQNQKQESEQYYSGEEAENERDQGWIDTDSEGDGEERQVKLTGYMKSYKIPSEKNSSQSGHTRVPYSLRSKSENKHTPKSYSMPLLEKTPGGGEVYQPFSYTDMHCILDKMPPPSEGGGPWMERFCKQTMGHRLALGDWRALLGQQLSSWDLTALETQAKTLNLPDKEPFARHATAIGQAMRQQFPIPTGAMHTLTFHIKPDENVATFLSRCKDTWVDVAGVHPGSGDLQTTLFRKAVLEGLPSMVRETLENNPDLPGCSTEQWEKHLTHHMKKHRAKQIEEKDNTESAQVQLLKLQLEDARRKTNDAKKADKKATNQMVQQPQPSHTDTPEGVDPRPPHWSGPRGDTGGFRGRGGGRGGPRGGRGGRGCYICGDLNHWKDRCPHQTCSCNADPDWLEARMAGHDPPPVRGGPPRGGYGGPRRGGYHAPNANMAPQGQYPMMSWDDSQGY